MIKRKLGVDYRPAEADPYEKLYKVEKDHEGVWTGIAPPIKQTSSKMNTYPLHPLLFRAQSAASQQSTDLNATSYSTLQAIPNKRSLPEKKIIQIPTGNPRQPFQTIDESMAIKNYNTVIQVFKRFNDILKGYRGIDINSVIFRQSVVGIMSYLNKVKETHLHLFTHEEGLITEISKHIPELNAVLRFYK